MNNSYVQEINKLKEKNNSSKSTNITSKLIINKLFEDPDFPASNTSLSKHGNLYQDIVYWRRPWEICDNPKFILDGVSRFDILQGCLGDCWLIAAITCLTLYPELINQVIPPNQTMEPGKGYNGKFRFNIWQFGKWTEVCVDDRLPTDQNGNLIFLRSNEENEFWSALLEKAYAKLMGSYSALKSGQTSEAMVDFTAGVCESLDLRKTQPDDLFQWIVKTLNHCSLIGCAFSSDSPGQEKQMKNGLIAGHAYSVTDAKMVEVNLPNTEGYINMIRLRNPWGRHYEWNGPWSDKSYEWNFIPDYEKKRIGLTFDSDGEFWMSFNDFLQQFHEIDICHICPQSFSSEAVQFAGGQKAWRVSEHRGCWTARVNAGGCLNYRESFWTNPQIQFSLDESDFDGRSVIVITLMQKACRRLLNDCYHSIGYSIFHVDRPNCGRFDAEYFGRHRPVGKSDTYRNCKSVSGRHSLPPSDYVILPTTYQPNQEGDFLLRIFTQSQTLLNELDEDSVLRLDDKDVKFAIDTLDGYLQNEQSEELIEKAFYYISGSDEEVDPIKLRHILNTTFLNHRGITCRNGFSLEVTRSMVALMDNDFNGRLNLSEFTCLWQDLQLWSTTFKTFDIDKNGKFNAFELRLALKNVGFILNNQLLRRIVLRYASRDGEIHFDDFILCCTRLKTALRRFHSQPKDASQSACLSIEQFVISMSYI